MSFQFSSGYLTENGTKKRKWSNDSGSSFINVSVNNIVIENSIQNKY